MTHDHSERDQDVVIVMVTAKDAEDDKVRGFEVGAAALIKSSDSLRRMPLLPLSS